ncbi:hypothetical protein [Ferrimicrobium sp.]|uniref:hypothetical protein n=1 Tax=Ferrimicrobium sp. TaxID=2926050 RepID=UPI00260E4EC9|nr:hypothetical protein [Ferrimicrobium sp.]
MGYRDHIVAKLSALAVAGGTTAMLFAASPVHTQFSATETGSLSATGAKVSESILAGDQLTATGLLPEGTYGDTSGYDWTNAKPFEVKNTGNVPENLTLTITGVNGIGVSGGIPNWAALRQLDFQITQFTPGTTSTTSSSPVDNVELTLADTTALSSGTPVSFPLTGTTPLPPLGSGYALAGGNLQVALVPSSTTNTGPGWGANDWNGASVTINYTITAEPASSANQPTLTAN